MLSQPPSFRRSQSPSEGSCCGARGASMGLQRSSVRGSGRSARSLCSTGPGRDVQGSVSCHAGLSAPRRPSLLRLPVPSRAQDQHKRWRCPVHEERRPALAGGLLEEAPHACAFGQQPWACSRTGTISPSSVPFQPGPGAGGKSCRLTLSKGVRGLGSRNLSCPHPRTESQGRKRRRGGGAILSLTCCITKDPARCHQF